MSWPPAVVDFKALFNREFVYGPGFNAVQDGDITRGLNQAGFVFNPALWATDQEKQIAYLYASAHFMVLNIQAAGGLASTVRGLGVNSHGGGTLESKGVGNVNVAYAVPDFVRQSPILSQFMRTDFGQSYLQLLTPRLVGNVSVVAGGFNQDADFAGNVAPLVIATQTLPNGTAGTPYSQQLQSIGGLAPVNWSKQTGTLPPGLTLAPTGILSGTPSLAGTYPFRVVAVDWRQTAAGQNLTVVIS